jgi:hypothetical protein
LVERRLEAPGVRGSNPCLATKFLDWLISAKNFTFISVYCCVCIEEFKIKVQCDKCFHGKVKCLSASRPFCVIDRFFFCAKHNLGDALDKWEAED